MCPHAQYHQTSLWFCPVATRKSSPVPPTPSPCATLKVATYRHTITILLRISCFWRVRPTSGLSLSSATTGSTLRLLFPHRRDYWCVSINGLSPFQPECLAEDFPTDGPDANVTESLMVLQAACFQSDTSHLTTSLAQPLPGTEAFKDALINSNPGNKIHGWNHYLIMLFFFVLTIIVEAGRFAYRTMPTLPFRPPA